LASVLGGAVALEAYLWMAQQDQYDIAMGKVFRETLNYGHVKRVELKSRLLSCNP
jgi:hypothetical protein